MVIELIKKFTPIPEQDIGQIKAKAAAHKIKLFDPILAECIAKRIIIKEFYYDEKKMQRSTKNILRLLVKEVNPKILDIIFSEDPLESHMLKIPRNQQQVFRIHNDVSFAIKNVIRQAYRGRKIHNRYVRQKTVGCLIHILNTVNNDRYIYAAKGK